MYKNYSSAQYKLFYRAAVIHCAIIEGTFVLNYSSGSSRDCGDIDYYYVKTIRGIH